MNKNDFMMKWALIIVGALLILNKLGIDLLKPQEESNTREDDPNKNKFNVNKANLTYSKDAYERLCTRLVQAMDTDELTQGTYEDEIYAVFKYMKTDDDVKELFNTFGARTYSGDEWGQWQLEADPKWTLGRWLRAELTSEEIQHINGILKKQGIKQMV